MKCSMSGFPVLHYVLEFASARVQWVEDAIQPIHPLLPSSPPALSLCQHQGEKWTALRIRVAKVLELQFQDPMNNRGWFPLGLTGLISLLSKGLSKSFLPHHGLKASVLWCSAFFMVQLSHLYMTTGKTIALTIWTFVGKMMCLLFNILSSHFSRHV